MNKHILYDANYAISLRGQTMEEAGMFDPQYMHPNFAREMVDFRTSISIAEGIYNDRYMNMPLYAEVLLTVGVNSGYWSKLTRAEWKRHYKEYRIYCKQGYEMHDNE